MAVADGFQDLLEDKSGILLGEKLLLNYPLEKFTSHADPRGDLKLLALTPSQGTHFPGLQSIRRVLSHSGDPTCIFFVRKS
jgi:hypothetical protein